MTAETITDVSTAQRTAPHNDYVGALAEFGLVGFALFVGLQFLLGSALWRRDRGLPLSERVRSPAFAALVIFVCFNVLGVLNNPSYFLDIQVAVWGLAGAGLASLAI
jgi:O-antigen ligase